MRPYRIWLRFNPSQEYLDMVSVHLKRMYGATAAGLGYASTYGTPGKFQYYIRIYY